MKVQSVSILTGSIMLAGCSPGIHMGGKKYIGTDVIADFVAPDGESRAMLVDVYKPHLEGGLQSQWLTTPIYDADGNIVDYQLVSYEGLMAQASHTGLAAKALDIVGEAADGAIRGSDDVSVDQKQGQKQKQRQGQRQNQHIEDD